MNLYSNDVLRVEGLVTEIGGKTDAVRVVDDVSFSVERGGTLGIVGESGSGKSMAMLSAAGLLPRGGRVTVGSAMFGGVDLLAISEQEMRRIRGREIGFIFQDPMSALNPVMSVGEQIDEAIRFHGPHQRRAQRRKQVVDLMGDVGIPKPSERTRHFPHQFSGGMRQRIMIAMAIANKPKLIIADEPTTSLDVTIQAQVLALIRAVQKETGSALILVTHDLGVVAEMAERVAVMCAGKIVETGSVDDIFYSPQNPYTIGLLAAVPSRREKNMLQANGPLK